MRSKDGIIVKKGGGGPGLSGHSIRINNNTISLIVSGEEETGKTLILTSPENIFSLQNVQVNVDGIEIHEADNLVDILNPNDDSYYPEYLIISTSSEQNQIIISVPHFSEHTITITQIIQEVAYTVSQVLLYFAAILIVAILYIVPIWYFQKK